MGFFHTSKSLSEARCERQDITGLLDLAAFANQEREGIWRASRNRFHEVEKFIIILKGKCLLQLLL